MMVRHEAKVYSDQVESEMFVIVLVSASVTDAGGTSVYSR